jgi:hypothetical protein
VTLHLASHRAEESLRLRLTDDHHQNKLSEARRWVLHQLQTILS